MTSSLLISLLLRRYLRCPCSLCHTQLLIEPCHHWPLQTSLSFVATVTHTSLSSSHPLCISLSSSFTSILQYHHFDTSPPYPSGSKCQRHLSSSCVTTITYTCLFCTSLYNTNSSSSHLLCIITGLSLLASILRYCHSHTSLPYPSGTKGWRHLRVVSPCSYLWLYLAQCSGALHTQGPHIFLPINVGPT